MPLLPSALPPKGEARRYATNDFLNLIAFSITQPIPTKIASISAYCSYSHAARRFYLLKRFPLYIKHKGALLSFGSGFKIQGSTEKVAAFAAYLYEAMPEGRTFASLSTLTEKFSKNQKTVQYSEKFFHFWKFVHYTEQFEHGAERMHTYAASFLLIRKRRYCHFLFFPFRKPAALPRMCYSRLDFRRSQRPASHTRFPWMQERAAHHYTASDPSTHDSS